MQHAAQAHAIFSQLGSPDREIAARTLARLRDKMGEEAFKAALEATGTPEPSGEPQGLSMGQVVQMISQNTVAVLTAAPEKKGEWLEALGQMQAQVKSQGVSDFAAFLGLLRQLVEGVSSELTPQVPPEFSDVWQAILKGIAKKE